MLTRWLSLRIGLSQAEADRVGMQAGARPIGLISEVPPLIDAAQKIGEGPLPYVSDAGLGLPRGQGLEKDDETAWICFTPNNSLSGTVPVESSNGLSPVGPTAKDGLPLLLLR